MGGRHIITLVGAKLYDQHFLPFIVAGVPMVLAVLMLLFFLREPRYLDGYAEDEPEKRSGVLHNLRNVPAESRRSCCC